jgi:hypothetical protein
MSEFKRKIEAYQQHGDRTVINDIMSAVEKKDFMGNRTRTRVKNGTASGGIEIVLKEDYEYIAYRIKAMQELILRHVKIEFDEDVRGLNEFQRLLSWVHYDFRIKVGTIYDVDAFGIGYFNITPELFAEIEKRMDEIEERFDEYEFRYFMRLFARFKDMEQSRREERLNRKHELDETAIAALEYALKYVDTTKSDKEIVKYINKSFNTKLADAELKRNGMRRIQRKKPGYNRMSYLVTPYFPDKSSWAIFGRDIEGSLHKLTADQRKFIADVVAIVENDRKNGDTTNYTCDTDGEVRISKKYIAEKLGMREDLVRKKLERIKKKLC